jgi:hypothetical protein
MADIRVIPSTKGEWWDEIWEKDSSGILRLVHVTPVKKNAKMDSAAILMAALMANDVTQMGILQHAQGRGDAGWGGSPPAVSTSDTTLFDEAGRLAPDSIVFLDLFDTPVAGPTNIIKISTTYDETELVGETLREQALFGGTATAAADSGIIINVIRHAPFFKGAFSLIRNIKLTFS